MCLPPNLHQKKKNKTKQNQKEEGMCSMHRTQNTDTVLVSDPSVSISKMVLLEPTILQSLDLY